MTWKVTGFQYCHGVASITGMLWHCGKVTTTRTGDKRVTKVAAGFGGKIVRIFTKYPVFREGQRNAADGLPGNYFPGEGS
jgi:hypothetical protein